VLFVTEQLDWLITPLVARDMIFGLLANMGVDSLRLPNLSKIVEPSSIQTTPQLSTRSGPYVFERTKHRLPKPIFSVKIQLIRQFWALFPGTPALEPVVSNALGRPQAEELVRLHFNKSEPRSCHREGVLPKHVKVADHLRLVPPVQK